MKIQGLSGEAMQVQQRDSSTLIDDRDKQEGQAHSHEAITISENSPYKMLTILMAQLLPRGTGVWPVAVIQVSRRKLLVTASRVRFSIICAVPLQEHDGPHKALYGLAESRRTVYVMTMMMKGT